MKQNMKQNKNKNRKHIKIFLKKKFLKKTKT